MFTLVLLTGLRVAEQEHHCCEILIFRITLQIDKQHQSRYERFLGALPKRVAAVRAFRRGRTKQQRYKLHTVYLGTQIAERIVHITAAAFAFFEIKHLDVVTLVEQELCTVAQQLTLRVTDNIRAVCLQNLRFRHRTALTCTGTADNHHIEVALVPEYIKANACVHGQRYVLVYMNRKCFPFFAALAFFCC